MKTFQDCLNDAGGKKNLLLGNGYYPYDLINHDFPNLFMTDNANWREMQYRYYENRNIRP